MPIYCRVTGETLAYKTQEELAKARLARMRHIVWLGVKTIAEVQKIDGGMLIMYTLTYAHVGEWEPRHVSRCVRWLREQGARAYVWVGELQNRGAVHYHILALLPKGQRWVKPNEANGGWEKGFTWVTPDIEHPMYIMKYLQKEQSKNGHSKFPKGFRLYAVSQWLVRRMCFEYSVSYRQSQLPRWFWKDAGNDLLVRASYRGTGVVCTPRLDAISPYSKRNLPDVAEMNGQEYTKLVTLCNQAQG